MARLQQERGKAAKQANKQASKTRQWVETKKMQLCPSPTDRYLGCVVGGKDTNLLLFVSKGFSNNSESVTYLLPR
ncbi:unnamed protein product [Sphagnum troendelagicum]|uniref:Uncharacterized protein n=1 Tax=Sphagnum troendelagicum TaxID=128251 RepID=A0ABP0TE64_9BRYO